MRGPEFGTGPLRTTYSSGVGNNLNAAIMNRKIVYLFFLILLLGCSKNPNQIAQENIEKHLKSIINDPSSYEFVSMTELDTIYKIPYYKERVLDYERFVKRIGLALERKKEELGTALSDQKKGEATIKDLKYQVEESQNFLDKNIKELQAYEKLLESSKEKDIKEIKTVLTIRENNKQGVKVLNKYYVSLNNNLTISSLN
ncbi:hypothetical protein SAMN05421636_1272 [Pricia antarctica]|uniref:Lipoprotein n=2 Tax=Pricia antarctica TaxID=641691 RepID=A0A1G7JGL9_9FLAO|nr:hypothetical protein SAMN05421636_1272 [Pricia antarctica]